MHLAMHLATVASLLASLATLASSSQPPPQWVQQQYARTRDRRLRADPVPLPPLVLVTEPPLTLTRSEPRAAPKDNGGKVVESFHVTADVRHRFATTTMVSVVKNTKGQGQEVTFDVTLPKEAFIMHFAMTIDNKTYSGEVKEKMAAKQQYQAAVARGESAGHVRQAARHANMFEVSVNVAAGSKVNFTLTYQELLRRSRGVYEYMLHVNPGQPVEDFRVTVDIEEKQQLKFVRTPALRTEALISNEVEAENGLTLIERPTPETARVTFQPSMADQGQSGVKGRFVVQYDVHHKPSGEVLVVDGYFVHFFAPDLPPMPKDIIFVLDLSGSMSGMKIRQLKEAMKVILGDLEPNDRFNIITFSSDVHRWREGLVEAGEGEVEAALTFVANMNARGMTNIDGALTTAVGDLAFNDTQRAGLVFFLTDGDPTQGERDMGKIADNVKGVNEAKAVIISLAFGDGADFPAMKTISAQNSGFGRKIYEASDAALQVSRLYSEVASVVVRGLNVTYLPSAVDAFTLTDTHVPVVYNGTEVIICGMLPSRGGRFSYDISGMDKSGELDISWEINDVSDLVLAGDDDTNMVLEGDTPPTPGPRDYAGLVERMWAFVTIKDMLKRRESHKGEDEEGGTKEEIIELALKYKLVTPLTSMVVTKPDTDRKSQASLQDADDVNTVAKHNANNPTLMASKRVAYSMADPGRHIQRGSNGPVGAVPTSPYPDFRPYHTSRRGGPGGMGPKRKFKRPYVRYNRNGLRATTTTTTTRRPYRQNTALRVTSPPNVTSSPPMLAPTSTTASPIVVLKPKMFSDMKDKNAVALLGALIIRNKDKVNPAACVVLKKVGEGSYLLFTNMTPTPGSPLFSVTIQTNCPKVKCKKVGVVSLAVTYNTYNIPRDLPVYANLSFEAASFSTNNADVMKFTSKKNTASLTGPGIDISIKKQGKKQARFSIYFTLKTSEAGGMLAEAYTASKASLATPPPSTTHAPNENGQSWWPWGSDKRGNKEETQKKQKKQKNVKKVKKHRLCKKFESAHLVMEGEAKPWRNHMPN